MARGRYYFSVEGQTEKLYLEWLEMQINADSRYPPVRFHVRVEKDPLAFARAFAPRGFMTVWHLCDMESADAVHMAHFRDILTRMAKAEEDYPEIEYQLAYTNFTFELWIILHKLDADRPLASRKQYLSLLNTAYGEDFQSLDHYKRKRDFTRILRKLSLRDVAHAVSRAQRIEQLNWLRCRPVRCASYAYFEQNPSLSLGECIGSILRSCGVTDEK